jgi:uncharacterized protein (DUF58 family)
VNRLSFSLLLVAFTGLVVALSTGAQVYYYISFTLLMMHLVALASVLTALLTVRATIRCPRRSTERGKSFPVQATVRHMSLLPVRSIALKLSLPGDVGAPDEMELTALPFVTKTYDLSLAAPHRGLYSVGIAGVSVTDVFGLFTLTNGRIRASFQVEVLPRVRELPPMEVRGGEDFSSRFTRMTEDNASPSDVRTWVPGDALKKVHWKLSMRKRELMVRTYEESARPDTLLLLDLKPLNTLKSHSLTVEDAVCETAAALASAQLKQSFPVRMPLMSARPTEVAGDEAGDAGKFVRALARVSFDSPYSFEQVLLLGMRRMQRTASAVLISPRLNPRIADLAMQLKRSGMQVTLCWISDSQQEEALSLLSLLEVGGARAFRVDPWGEGLTREQIIGKEAVHG